MTRRRLVRVAALIIVIPLVASGMWLLTASVMYSPEYVMRVVTWGESDVGKYLNNFPKRQLTASAEPRQFPTAIDAERVEAVLELAFGVDDLDAFQTRTQTQSLIVISRLRRLGSLDPGFHPPQLSTLPGGRERGAGSVSGAPAATTAAPRRRRTTMIERMDHVGIVVDDLAAATEFFVELGLDLEVEMPVEGRWVDRVVGLDDVRVDIAMVRTPDGHGRLELTKFHTPTAVSAESNAPANTLGIRRIMFAVDDIDAVVAGLRARGAELVGEVAQYEDSLSALLRARPRGHHRRAGRAAQLDRQEKSRWDVENPRAASSPE